MAARDVIWIVVAVFALAVAFIALHSTANYGINALISIPVIQQNSQATEALQSSAALSDRMDYVIFIFFLATCFGIIITGYLIGAEPIFLFIYFLIVIIGVVVSTILSNGWETITSLPFFVASAAKFPITTHILSHLPTYAAVIGFLGMMAMFAKPYSNGGGYQ